MRSPWGAQQNTKLFKDQEFFMLEWISELNVYCIKPVTGDSPEKVVNHWQLWDLEIAHNENDTTSEEELGEILLNNPKNMLPNETPHKHKYATQSKGHHPSLVQNTIAGIVKESSSEFPIAQPMWL